MTLPAEWAPQQLVEIAWPHADSDWLPYLDSARVCFAAIGEALAQRGIQVLIVTADQPSTRSFVSQWSEKAQSMTRIVPCPTNDTWTRDNGFITLMNNEGEKRLTDFCFNGWGDKFEASLDNAINAHILPVIQELYGSSATLTYADALNIVLEGGSIESDGCGTILTTTSCLLAPHRNDFADKAEAEAKLLPLLGARRMLWLDHGYLAGDDTDGHVDTLARLAPDDTIVYVGIDDPEDEHYTELQAMEAELQALRTADGHPYRLLALPMAPCILESDFPDAVAEEGDQRLPSTYANYLITNGAVLMPTYAAPEEPADSDARHRDQQAMEVLAKAYPGREIVPIDCRVLVRQHGSLHCSTMQFPK